MLLSPTSFHTVKDSLGERPSAGTIMLHVKPANAQTYRSMMLNSGINTFPEIADRCREVAAQKRLKDLH